MKRLAAYGRLICFFVAAMIGIQIPQFVDQYGDAVYAHLHEAKASVAEFQQEADRYFDGSIERLIDYYRASDDPVFIDGGDSIEGIYQRYQTLQSAWNQYQQSYWQRYQTTFLSPITDIRREAWARYDYAVRLTPEALVMAVSVGLFVSLLADLLLSLLLWPLRKRRTVAN